MNFYESTIRELAEEIEKLIDKHPEIINFTSPWGLLDYEEIKTACNRLSPSLLQAGAAMSLAIASYSEKEKEHDKTISTE